MNLIERPPSPIAVSLETVFGCNIRCEFCHYHTRFNSTPLMYVPVELAKVVAQQCLELGVPSMLVHSEGECLLHPQFAEVLQPFRNHMQLRILASNGSRLLDFPEGFFANAKGFTICLSIDSPIKAQYEQFRRGASWDRLWAGIDKHKATPKLTFVVRAIAMASNADALVEFPKLLGKYPTITSFEVIHLVPKKGSTCDATQELRFKEDFTRDLSARIRAACKEYKVNYNPHIETHLDKKHGCYRVLEHACLEPFERLHVKMNGDVCMCLEKGFKKQMLGNVNSTTLKEIWNSEQVQELRSAFVAKQIPAYCKDCKAWKSKYENL